MRGEWQRIQRDDWPDDKFKAAQGAPVREAVGKRRRKRAAAD